MLLCRVKRVSPPSGCPARHRNAGAQRPRPGHEAPARVAGRSARQERSRPGRAAGWRPGCTSTATKPSWRSHRVSPAPQLPAPSTPTRSMTPHCDGPTRRAGGTRGGGHDGDRAEMATKLIERRGDVGIGVGINPGRDERLGRWHRGNGRLPSLRGGRWRATGRVVSAAPAGGCLRRRASRPPGGRGPARRRTPRTFRAVPHRDSRVAAACSSAAAASRSGAGHEGAFSGAVLHLALGGFGDVLEWFGWGVDW